VAYLWTCRYATHFRTSSGSSAEAQRRAGCRPEHTPRWAGWRGKAEAFGRPSRATTPFPTGFRQGTRWQKPAGTRAVLGRERRACHRASRATPQATASRRGGRRGLDRGRAETCRASDSLRRCRGAGAPSGHAWRPEKFSSNKHSTIKHPLVSS